MNLLVLGASGGCGRWIVRLAAARGHHVRAVVRPATAFDPPAGVEVVRGDVLDPVTLDQVLPGRDAVLSALGTRRRTAWNPWSPLASPPDLTTRVAEDLAAAMPRHGVRRVVVISAAGVGESRGDVHPLIRWMIEHSTVGASYADLAGMEAALAGSGLDWTAVRPTTLTDGPPTGTTHVTHRYGLGSRIRRADVAAWMLDAVEQPSASAARTPLLAGG